LMDRSCNWAYFSSQHGLA